MVLGNGIFDFDLNSFFSFCVCQFFVSEPLSLLGIFINNTLVMSLGNNLSNWGRFLCVFLGSNGVLSDFSVDFLVQFFEILDLVFNKGSFPFGELKREFFLLLFLQKIHILLDVVSEDVVSVFLGNPVGGGLSFFENFSFLSLGLLSFLNVMSWESLVVVGNE